MLESRETGKARLDDLRSRRRASAQLSMSHRYLPFQQCTSNSVAAFGVQQRAHTSPCRRHSSFLCLSSVIRAAHGLGKMQCTGKEYEGPLVLDSPMVIHIVKQIKFSPSRQGLDEDSTTNRQWSTARPIDLICFIVPVLSLSYTRQTSKALSQLPSLPSSNSLSFHAQRPLDRRSHGSRVQRPAEQPHDRAGGRSTPPRHLHGPAVSQPQLFSGRPVGLWSR